MAKRFTDTEKFTHPWYRRLPSKYKLLWEYLLCSCDYAGIVRLDLELIEVILKEKFKEDEMHKLFEDRLVAISPGKFLIPNFIEFQYGKLNPASKVHTNAILRLEKEGVDYKLLNSGNIPRVALGYPYPVARDKEKEKEKDKEKVKEKEKEKDSYTNTALNSPMDFLTDDAEIKSWLKTGTVQIQQEILSTYGHDYLRKIIVAAYAWQNENKKRKAGTFLKSWIERDPNALSKSGDSLADDNFKKAMIELGAHFVEEAI